MRPPLAATLTAACLAAFLLVSCDPPGKPKTEGSQAENREAILDFKTLFNSNCSGCHGLNGRNGPARILKDPLYLSLLPRETLQQIIIYGRPGTAMPAWAKSRGGPLTDQQVEVLVNGMYTAWGRPPAAAPEAPSYASAASGDPVHGKQLFARGCFMCHGKGAAVGPVSTPNYLALVSTQMLRTSIIIGRPDLGMPDYRHLNLGKALKDQDVTDLVAYLSSLRTAPAPGEMAEVTRQQSPKVNEGNSSEGSSSQRGVK